MEFTKWQGCGNDFVLIDCRERELADYGAFAKKVSDRHFGIGADGVLVVLDSNRADYRMRIFNTDGSEAEMCGNGIRCFARYLRDHGVTDRDKFTVHPNILSSITVFVMELGENQQMQIRQETGRLEDILKEHLGLSQVTLIPCGQGHTIDAAREQWSDGSNTLAIAPGEVVVYTRNYVTNRSLEEAGIRIHAIPSAELSRGRGGPRCMSMPLIRDDP